MDKMNRALKGISFKIITLVLMCFVFCGFSLQSLKAIKSPPGKAACSLPADRSVLKSIRVGLCPSVKEAEVEFDGKVYFKLLETGDLIDSRFMSGRKRLKGFSSGVIIGEVPVKVYAVELEPASGFFVLNGKEYRGSLIVYRQKNMNIRCVNKIGLEDYLKGVLAGEMISSWPIEALKAQAVVSRTYAVFRICDTLNKDYAVVNTVSSQVYGGKKSETSRTNLAVDSTRGQVMICRGKVFSAFFHANCGGHTTAPETVWYTRSYPALRGTVCDFCSGSKHYYWKKVADLEAIEKSLKQKGYDINGLRDVQIKKTDSSGRVTRFELICDSGNILIKANLFRIAVGAQKMRSTLFTAFQVGRGALYMEGLGWGHGVGLCQSGAKGMADSGFSFEDIIQYYFSEKTVLQNLSHNGVYSAA